MDEQALRSIKPGVAGPADLDSYVNLIKGDWELLGPDEAEELRREFETDDPFDEGEEAIEGCKMHDVGLIKVEVHGLMADAYTKLQTDLWDENYVRPPGTTKF